MSGKYALIIANTEYTDPGLLPLTAPGKDAEDLARVLRAPNVCGFDDVNILFNQPSFVISEAIEDFFYEKKPDDLLVVYFSGHGVRDEFGKLYLAVKNTNRTRLRATAIRSDYLREAMDQSRSKRQVLILDCCHGGAFPQGSKAEVGGAMGMARAFQGYGRFTLTASDAIQLAWEGDKVIGKTQNSLFTHFLVRGLEGEADIDSDGNITVDELYDYTFEQISKVTPKQTPTKSASAQEGEIVLRQIPPDRIKLVDLPEDLKEEIADPRPAVREWAVQRLEKILNGKNLGMRRSARVALERMAKEDDSRRVCQAAAQVLGRNPQGNTRITPDPVLQSRTHLLEAAIEKEITVGKATQLFVLVRRSESKGIIAVIRSTDEEVLIEESNVKSKAIHIEFPVENGQILPVEIILRVTAQDFFPPDQQKWIVIPPDGDSEVSTFMITPRIAGRLTLQLEVFKEEISLTSRTIRTTAVDHHVTKNFLALFTMPMFVFVQDPTHMATHHQIQTTSQRSGSVGQAEKKVEVKEEAKHSPTVKAREGPVTVGQAEGAQIVQQPIAQSKAQPKVTTISVNSLMAIFLASVSILLCCSAGYFVYRSFFPGQMPISTPTLTAVNASTISTTATPNSTSIVNSTNTVSVRPTSTIIPSSIRTANANATTQSRNSYISTHEAEAQLVYGPRDGSLAHFSNDDSVLRNKALVSLRNFIVSATFVNPYSTTKGTWDYGFFFRETDFNEQYRLVVTSNKTWELQNVTASGGTKFTTIHEGRLTNLNVSEDASNTIWLLCQGSKGMLYVNGNFISDLDLSTRQSSGDIAVGTGFFTGNEINGYSTDYQDFNVWKVP